MTLVTWYLSLVIYLDHAATTPLDPRVYDTMLPYLKDVWGNPSSPHAKGREARAAVDTSRQQIADQCGVKPSEVVFVSSGSEATSLAINGVCTAWLRQGKNPGQIITLPTEHKATLQTVEQLAQHGWTVTYLPVDDAGLLQIDDLEQAITGDTVLVTLHWVNNEIGAIQPIAEAVQLCKAAKVPCHCDALQAIGQLPLPDPLPDLLSLAAHKFYGPKGIGALLVHEDVEIAPQTRGGGQEFTLRAGTENVPGAVGLATALEIACTEQTAWLKRSTDMSTAFLTEVLQLPGVSLNGPTAKRLPSIMNLQCSGHIGETLVMQLDLEGICVSTGSACTTGSAEPSHVLLALGQSEEQARSNLRVSLGRGTSSEEIDQVLQVLQSLLVS